MLGSDVQLEHDDRLFWQNVFNRLELTPDGLDEFDRRAVRNGTDIFRELRISGTVSEERLLEVVAGELGIDAAEDCDGNRLLVAEADCINLLSTRTPIATARYSRRALDVVVLLSPFRLVAGAVRSIQSRDGPTRERLRLIRADSLRSALATRARDLLIRRACHGLADQFPWFSARSVPIAWQGAFFGALAVLLPVGLLMAPWASMLAIQGVASFCFLACVLLRCMAAFAVTPRQTVFPPREPEPSMPIYTVMVALYREAAMVPDLLASLSQLYWPRNKLEVKLVCEDDDHETLAALDALALRPFIEIIRVPPAGPRTKPKALAYALPFCRGDLVALYDAEDRPHSMQLLEAWKAFQQGEPTLACVQAPLVISNHAQNAITRSFALEYAALFRGLLPWLAKHGLVLPLGGTSNHFRRDILMGVGAWDPYNVTEDADLGLRLCRFCYRTGIIQLPTHEDAPHRWRYWLPQRTRWLKGWMQTLLRLENYLKNNDNISNEGRDIFCIATI